MALTQAARYDPVMGSYGQYEAVREVYHSAVTSLWTARPAGSSLEPAFVVKLLSPAEGLWKAEEVAPAIAAFLEKAKLQQKLGREAGAHWVAIHDLGEIEGGAYYVADLFPQSLQRPIAGQIRFDEPALFQVISGIVQGLDELHRAARRYHGNLKLHNVMLAGQLGGKDLSVALSDPANHAEGPANDFFFIGQLIYEAVLRKPFKPLTGWPVGESEEWVALGRKGERWRALCNKLLCPDPAERPANLPEMHRELRTLRLRLESKRSRAAAAALVVVLGLGAWGAYQYMQYRSEWPALQAEYAAWFGQLHDQLLAHPEWLSLRAVDARLPAALAQRLADAQNLELDPRKAGGMSISSIRQTPHAAATVKAVERALEEWTLPHELADQKDQRKREGQVQLAEYLAKLPGEVKPGPGVDVARGIEETLRTAAALAQLDAQRRSVGALSFNVEGATGNPAIDRLLARFSARARQALAADPPVASAQDIETQAAALQASARELAAFGTELAPRLSELARRQNILLGQGWSKLAGSIAQEISAVTPNADLAAQGRHLAELVRNLDQIEAQWQALTKQSQPMRQFRDSADPYVASYLEYLDGIGELGDAAQIQASLQKLAQVPQWGEVARFLQAHGTEVDWRYFESTARLTSPSRPPTDTQVQQWLQEVRKPAYALLGADPRPGWKPDLSAIRAELAKLAADPEAATALEQRLAAEDRDIAQLRTLAWDRGHADQIREGMTRIDQSLPTLLADVKAAIALLAQNPLTPLRGLLEADKDRKSVQNGQRLLDAMARLGEKERSSPLGKRLMADVKEYYQPHTITNTIGMKLVRIEPGTFLMGSPPTEAGRPRGTRDEPDDEPQFQCTISRPFYIASFEVTRGQFAEFVKATRYVTDAERRNAAGLTPKLKTWKEPGYEQQDDHPVVGISWNDAVAFCDWLGTKDRRKYRLPSEFEWEYACRAGGKTAYAWGNDAKDGQGYLNGRDASGAKALPGNEGAFPWDDGYAWTSPVGKFKPNAWGLYDMEGNAWEWTGSWYADYPKGAATDPRPLRSPFRTVRGGAWGSEPTQCRSAYRSAVAEDYSNEGTGFRVVLESEY